MAHSIDFMKTGCTSKISQISEFQNHLPKNLTFIFLSLRANQKNQFAMTDPALLFVKLPVIEVVVDNALLEPYTESLTLSIFSFTLRFFLNSLKIFTDCLSHSSCRKVKIVVRRPGP